MLLKDLTKVYISEYEEIEDHGEIKKVWKYKGIAWLHLQQDVNELDRNSAGTINYDIYKGRTDREGNIQNDNGISIIDISQETDFVPEYRVLDQNKIGTTYMYRMEKYHGN